MPISISSTPALWSSLAGSLLNMLIHSLAYIEVVGDTGAYEGFMVTSDREREHGLFQVDMAVYTTLMREVEARISLGDVARLRRGARPMDHMGWTWRSAARCGAATSEALGTNTE